MYRAVTLGGPARDGVDHGGRPPRSPSWPRRTRVNGVDGPGPPAGSPSTVHSVDREIRSRDGHGRGQPRQSPRNAGCARGDGGRAAADGREHAARVGVAEGRDIGTVVAPAAPLKVFLTASPDARAHRRSRQDGTTDHRSTAADLDRRDTYDSTRTHSPLRAADDAVHVDTTALTINEVVQRLVDLAMERGIVQEPRPGSSATDAPRR